MQRSLFSVFALLCATASFLTAEEVLEPNPVMEVLELDEVTSTWECIPDVAEYKLADWDNVVMRVDGITAHEAKCIAESYPEIDYFFITTGCRFVLENEEAQPPTYRVFNHGDTIFFSGKPWWGSAPGLADGYIKG